MTSNISTWLNLDNDNDTLMLKKLFTENTLGGKTKRIILAISHKIFDSTGVSLFYVADLK